MCRRLHSLHSVGAVDMRIHLEGSLEQNTYSLLSFSCSHIRSNFWLGIDFGEGTCEHVSHVSHQCVSMCTSKGVTVFPSLLAGGHSRFARGLFSRKSMESVGRLGIMILEGNLHFLLKRCVRICMGLSPTANVNLGLLSLRLE